nr:outer dense fiber of sperm tails 2 [Hymenolepis microstoma]
MINRSPNIKYFSRTNSHWIPPPAKTTNAPKRTKSITNIDASRYRRSRSWSPSEEKIDKRDEEKPRNWAKVVNDIDRSIENLSHSVQGLLKDTKNEKEEIHFEHTPVRDAVSNGEIDRLASELQQTREELHHAETRQASLEALKSHLQLQLRQRSAQCDRIVAHLLNSKSKTRQTVVKLTQQLADADDKIQKLCKQHSLLKQAAKGQKKRAIKAEEEIARLRDDNGENGEKRNVGDTAKAIAHLEQDNKRLRELADSYEERLAIKEKEVEKLRERLSQTNGKDLTIKDGFEKISSNSSRSISPGKTKIEPQSDLPTPLPPSIDKETEMAVTIQDLREKLAQSEASNKNLHAYLAFLKHSYSSIFDDDDEKKDVPATPAFVTVVAPNDVSPGLIA